MNTNLNEYYLGLHDSSASAFNHLKSDGNRFAAFALAHNYLDDFAALEQAITSRPEADMLRAAIKEYQFSLYALSIAQYRYAFIGLRLFFELSLSAVQFSAHEIDYRLWNAGKKDVNWKSIVSQDNGIFSTLFVDAFSDDFAEQAKLHKAIAETAYRECSEFVHGNAETHQNLPTEICYKGETLDSWAAKAKSVRQAYVFAYSARYLNHLTINEKKLIEHPIIETVGHLPSVQAAYAS